MENELIRIGDIGNYYGGLYVSEREGRYFWVIENYDGVSDDQEIPKSLYDELVKFGTGKQELAK